MARNDGEYTDFEHFYRERRGLASTIRFLDSLYGPGKWGEDERRQYLRELYEASEDTKIDSVEPDELDKKIAEYMQYVTNPSPADRMMLERLAFIDITLGKIQRQMVAEAELKPTQIQRYAKIQSGLSKEAADIQKSLGIDRATLQKMSGGEDMAAYIQHVVKEAAEFLRSHTIPIRCPHCLSEKASVNINMGYILFHFAGDVPWRFSATCPRCGKEFVVTN